MAAGAAPEIPVLAYLAIGLLALLSWIVLRGLISAWRATFGYLLERLAGVLHIHVRFVHVDFGGPVRALDRGMMNALGFAAAKSEHAAGYFFHGAAVLQEWASRELWHLARETEGTLEWLAHVHVPKWAKWALPEVAITALVVKLVRRLVRAELPHLQHLLRGATAPIERVAVPRAYRPLAQRVGKLEKALAAAAGATATLTTGALTWPWAHVHVFPRLRALERWEGHTKKRLRRLEPLLGVTAFAGLMAKVLGLPNWRCLTRGNVGRTARALCGVPAHLLGDLLAVLADVWILENVCIVIPLLEDAAATLGAPLVAALTEVGAGFCPGSIGGPHVLQVRAYTPPPPQGSSAPVEV